MSTTYRVNDDALRKARQMIDAHQYDVDTDWSDAAPTTEESNDKIDRDGYDDHDEVERAAGELLEHLDEVRA